MNNSRERLCLIEEGSVHLVFLFPPIMGDWRGIGFVKLLPGFGWQPIVISASESVSYGKDYSLLKQVPSEPEVYRIGHREPKCKEWQYAGRTVITIKLFGYWRQ